MEQVPACPVCRGTGFAPAAVDGAPGVRPCPCRVDERRRLRLRSAAIPERYAACTLDHFEIHHESQQRALAFARRIVEEFPSGDHGLLLCGPCGVGKTHVAVAVLRRLIEERGASGLFTEFTRLLRRIQDTYDSRSETPSWAVIEPALGADVLVLDDLGSTRMTPWVQDTLGLIVNERYSGRKLTIITTNRPETGSPKEESLADRIGIRLVSRLAEMCWTVPVAGPDYRRQFKAAEFR
jgi:DNA replication protein DnaC